MTTDDTRAGIDAARQVAAELAGLIAGEGPSGLVWQQRMRQIAADLAVRDAPDADVLAAARERFDSLYRGGRDFSDFYLRRTDEGERIAANQHLARLVEQLRGLLYAQ
jgi:hypothetical protein